MSLRARVTLLVAVLVAVASIIGGVGAHRSTASELRDETDDFLLDRVDRFTGPGALRFIELLDRRPGLGGVARPALGGLDFFDPDAITQVVSDDGGVVLKVRDAPTVEVSDDVRAAALDTGAVVLSDVGIEGQEHRVATARIDDDLLVQVARSQAETEQTLGGLARRLLLLTVVVTGAGALLGWFGSRLLSRPIEQLTDRVEHIARTQELDVAVDVQASGEVGRLAGSFRAMLDALSASRRQQHELIRDAGHELRTPITTLGTSLELLRRPDLPPEHRERLLASVGDELAELTNLVTELVDLGTDTRTSDPPRPTDLVEVADRVVQRARRRHRRDIEVTGVDVAVVRGQPAMLERAVNNLVDNAVKFSPDGTPIEVRVDSDGVWVRDRGPGIPASDLRRVFDRFYRAESSRTLPGSGLGLSIVAHVAAEHGGRAEASNAHDGGAIVGFRIGSDAQAS